MAGRLYGPGNTLVNVILLHGAHALGRHWKKSYVKKGGRGAEISEKTLMKLIRKSRNTEFGKKYGFSQIQSIEDYQRLVPLTTYEDYREYVERTANNGEQGLMTGAKIRYLAMTSGTVRQMKLIPQVNATFIPYFKCVCVYADELVGQMRRRKISGPGRGLLMTEVSQQKTGGTGRGRRGIQSGYISSFSVNRLKPFIPVFTCLPGDVIGSSEIGDMKYVKARYALQDPDLVYLGAVLMSALSDIMTYMIDNHEMLIHDIETGTIDPSIHMTNGMRRRLESKLRPDPERAAELREAFSAPSEEPLVLRIWKNMALVASIGTGDFAPFTEKMRVWCGDAPAFDYIMYSASESLFACAMNAEDTSYLLLPDGGFYEFLPVDEDEEDRRPLLMNELEVGKHYEVVVTNLAGLYRYQIKDIVRVTGFEGEIPYIQFAYRKNQLINFGGTHLTGEHLAAFAAELEKELGVLIRDYSAYPDTKHEPSRIVMFIETDRDIPPEKEERLSELLEQVICHLNEMYRLHRAAQLEIAPAVAYRVRPGTYMRWRDKKIAEGASVNQLKAVRFIDTQEKLDFFMSQVAEEDAAQV